MIWTGLVPKIDSFAYFFTLVITPMFLFSGVFFPMEVLPEILQRLAWVLPLYHVVTLVRSLALGAVSVGLFYNVLVLLAIIIITFPLPQILMHRRLIK
jgi:lipooligosaccharide transport system permease protein